MDKTSKEIWADYRNGRKFYMDFIEVEKTAEKGVCPNCKQITHIDKVNHVMKDFESDEIIEDESNYFDFWCGFGCELSSMEFYKPFLDKKALKVEIMGSRARMRDNSMEVFNYSDNPYLHGYNCLYIHWQQIERGQHTGEYSVFFDYYLEYAHNGRNESVGKKDMIIQKKRPASKEAKELLYAWMVERFEKDTKGNKS